jgi:hypothetical protein
MTLMTVYSTGVNSAFQAAQTNEQFGVELFGVNYSHLESSYKVPTRVTASDDSTTND